MEAKILKGRSKFRKDPFEGALPWSDYVNQTSSLKMQVTNKSLSHETAYTIPLPSAELQGVPLENEILSDCISYLKSRSVNFDRIQVQGQLRWSSEVGTLTPSSMKGMADLQIVISGHAYFAEVKRPGGKLTTVQKNWLEDKQRAGAHCAIVCSAEGLAKFIEKEFNHGVFLKRTEIKIYY